MTLEMEIEATLARMKRILETSQRAENISFDDLPLIPLLNAARAQGAISAAEEMRMGFALGVLACSTAGDQLMPETMEAPHAVERLSNAKTFALGILTRICGDEEKAKTLLDATIANRRAQMEQKNR